MKTTTQFLMASVALIFAFTACKKNTDNEETLHEIVGKWTFVKSEYEFNYDGEIESGTDFPEPGSFFEFKADGTFAMQIIGVTTASGTWSINGNILTLQPNNGPGGESVEIIKLTKTELVFRDTSDDGHETLYLTR